MNEFVAYFPTVFGVLIVIDLLILFYVKKDLYKINPYENFYSSRLQKLWSLFLLAIVFADKPKAAKYGPNKRPVDFRKLVPRHVFILCFLHKIISNVLIFGALPGLYLYLRLLAKQHSA